MSFDHGGVFQCCHTGGVVGSLRVDGFLTFLLHAMGRTHATCKCIYVFTFHALFLAIGNLIVIVIFKPLTHVMSIIHMT